MATETLFDIIKYGEYRPVKYRKILDVYFEENVMGHVGDWKDANENINGLFDLVSPHYDHMYITTHFIRVDVYYDTSVEATMVTLSILDNEISQIIVDNDYDVTIQAKIQTDNDDVENRFLEVFDEFYKEMSQACLGIEYRLEWPDE
jgi:hypothetical protein